ncbi:hypothetical protein YPPY09_1245, partial [Yersinia pestis PY-09]
MSQGHIDLLHY